MAGLVPAIHDLSRNTKNVDARDKPGHDELLGGAREGWVEPSRNPSCFVSGERIDEFLALYPSHGLTIGGAATIGLLWA
jgi:hypothetical protein